MNTDTRFLLFLFRRFLYLLAFALLAAMVWTQAFLEKEDELRTLDDLTGGEFVFVERMVLLERAKAVALLDRPAGEALFDSLSAAWGDSSLQGTLSGAPTDPVRSEAVAALLRRVVAAEQESLLANPGQDRLHLPLPEPAPVPPEPEPES